MYLENGVAMLRWKSVEAVTLKKHLLYTFYITYMNTMTVMMVMINYAPLDGMMLLFNSTLGASTAGFLVELIHAINKSEIVIFNITQLFSIII